jgi:hypothetical protein
MDKLYRLTGQFSGYQAYEKFILSEKPTRLT